MGFSETFKYTCVCLGFRTASMNASMHAHASMNACGTQSLVASLWLHELWPARLLCPWDSPGKNTGVGCHFLLQEIFLTQELNPHLLHLLFGSLFFTTVPPGEPIPLADIRPQFNRPPWSVVHIHSTPWQKRQNSLYKKMFLKHAPVLEEKGSHWKNCHRCSHRHLSRYTHMKIMHTKAYLEIHPNFVSVSLFF